jgi:hypothetical protein
MNQDKWQRNSNIYDDNDSFKTINFCLNLANENIAHLSFHEQPCDTPDNTEKGTYLNCERRKAKSTSNSGKKKMKWK